MTEDAHPPPQHEGEDMTEDAHPPSQHEGEDMTEDLHPSSEKGDRDVKKDIDCRIFEEQLDALMEGRLSEEGVEQLQLHALTCPDCAMLLRVQKHLSLPSLESLESAVPPELLESMWPRVEEETVNPRRFASAEARAPVQSFRSWLVPLLAAASLVLLFSTGYLVTALMASQAREERLAQEVSELDWWMANADRAQEWVLRTGALAPKAQLSRALDFGLAGEESVEIGRILEILGSLPGDRILLDAASVRALTEARSPPPPELRDLLLLLEEAVATLGDEEGVRAGELRQWLSSSPLPSDMVVPTSSLIELFS